MLLQEIKKKLLLNGVHVITVLCLIAIIYDGIFQFQRLRTIFSPIIYLEFVQSIPLFAFYFSPKIGGWICVAIWWICCFIPDAPFSVIFSVLFIIGYLSYSSIIQGLIACVTSVLLYLYSVDLTSNDKGTSFFVVIFTLSFFTGTFIQMSEKAKSEKIFVDNMARNREITHKLHDNVTNDICDALLLIQAYIKSGNAVSNKDIILLNKLLIHALDKTHDAIRIIDLGESNVTNVNKDVTYVHDLLDCINLQKEVLASLGFEGEIIISNTEMKAINLKQKEWLKDFCNELFTNIAKYSDPTSKYIFTFSFYDMNIIIGLSDSPSHNQHSIGLNTGLKRFEDDIREINGSLNISSSDVFWSLKAVIPIL